MKKKQLKNQTNEIDMKYMRDIIDKLIKNNKIKFEFYNSTIPLELLQICFNEKENTVWFHVSARGGDKRYGGCLCR